MLTDSNASDYNTIYDRLFLQAGACIPTGGKGDVSPSLRDG